MSSSIKAFILEPLVLSCLIGLLVFIICYLQFPKVLRFFKEKTINSQEEILRIMDMMLVRTSPSKIIFRLWLMGIGVWFLIFLLLWPHLLIGLLLGSIGFLCSWIAVQKIMQTVWEKRCDQLVHQMVEGLVIMTNAVKVGLSVSQGMDRVTKGLQTGPLVQEFQLVLNKIHLGMSIEEALNEMGKRIDRPDVHMMVTSINILKETGGNIAETLDVISETIRERQKLDNKIKALTAQGAMQAKIVSAVPFILLIIMFVSNKQYAILMLTTPLGWASLVIILILIGVSGFLMNKLVTIKV